MKLTVVLPAYNEERDLPPLLDRIGQSLSASELDYTILVVDDGSTDRTAELTRDAAKRWPVSLLQHPKNKGLGAAVLSGLQAAMKTDGIVITMDADNSHDPSVIPAMVKLASDSYDLVIASRFQPGGQEVGVPGLRKVFSHTASFLLGVFFPYKNVRDYSAGYRAYRASILRRLRDAYGDTFIRERGFACMLEVLLKIRSIGGRATEIPLILRYDMKAGASKMRVARTVRSYFTVGWRASIEGRRVAADQRLQRAALAKHEHVLEGNLGGK
jgi:dolichol-phosphate mannosyltransferase